MNKLDGKVVVVTGGAGLIGNCFAKAIADSGGIAVVADVDIDAARRVALNSPYERSGFFDAAEVDITNVDSVRALIANLCSRYGRIDAVVNNAYPRNQNYGRKLEEVTYADFCENVDMHLGGYFLVAQQFCMKFQELGGGSLVNMSSVYGTIAPRFEIYDGTSMTMPVEYAAIKAAIEHLTRYFAQYFKQSGIRVNSLSPGGIYDHQPGLFVQAYNARCASKGMLAPGDLIGALLFLLSDDSLFVTGQNITVDDGFSL